MEDKEIEIPKEIRDFEITCKFFVYKDWESISDFKNKASHFIALLQTKIEDAEGHIYKDHIVEEFREIYNLIEEKRHQDPNKVRRLTIDAMNEVQKQFELSFKLLRSAILDKQIVFRKAV